MAAGFHAWSQGIATYAIGALYPTVTWCDLALYAAQTRVYFNYALCAYTVAGGWVNISDEREKEDIQDLKTSRSLERIMALKPKHYRRIYRNGTTPVPDKVKEARLVGFLAQDVLKTNPHCVSTWQNQEAKTDDDDGVRFGICYNDYITHLVGAVQEQQKQIQIQQEKMDALIARDKVIVEHARQLEEDLKTTKEDLKTTKDAFSSYREMTDARINKLASLVAQLIK